MFSSKFNPVATTTAIAFVSMLALQNGALAGDTSSIEVPVADFDSITIEGAVKGKIEVNGKEAMTASGRNVEERLEVEIDDGELHIITSDNRGRNKAIKVDISAATLNALRVTGAGRLEVSGIKAETFDISMPGAADINLSGTCGTLTLELAGAGKVDAKALKCENVEVNLSGAASVSVYGSESVDASVAGVGKIDIYGKPDTVEKSVSGIGRIKVK